MVRECQMCGLERSVCNRYRRDIAYGRSLVIFLFMEAVFGSAIMFAVTSRAYAALFVFAVAAFTSIVLVVRSPWS
jgi:hypothetical protein